MAFEKTNKTRFFYPHTPVEVTPPSLERKSIAKPQREERIGKEGERTLSFGSRVSHIPKQTLDFFRDSGILLLLIDTFEMTSRFCELSGGSAGRITPYLALITAPGYLYYACKGAANRLSLMREAIAVSDFVEAAYWGAGGIDALGAAIGDVTKGFAGGIQIAGVPQTRILGILFTVAIPILLICTGTIGGIAKGWALWRNAQALKNFKEKTSGADTDLKALEGALRYLQGAKAPVKEDEDTDRVARQRFQDNHFSSDANMHAIEKRIDGLISHHQFRLLESVKKNLPTIPADAFILAGEMKETQVPELITLVENFYEELLTHPRGKELQHLQTIVDLYGKLENAIPEDQDFNDFFKNLKEQIAENKKELLKEGKEIIDLAESDIHRVMLINAFYILLGTIGLTAGILILASHQHRQIAIYMSVGTGILDIAYLIFEKKVDQERFLALEKFFRGQ